MKIICKQGNKKISEHKKRAKGKKVTQNFCYRNCYQFLLPNKQLIYITL